MARIGYARCSSEEQARDSQALDYQAARLEEHCGVGNVVRDFTSASKVPLPRRAAFREAIERLQALPTDRPRILLVTRWDRLSRRVADIRHIRNLEAQGIQFQSLDSGQLADGAMGGFTFTMALAMAEYEADLLSEKISHRYADRRRQRQPMNCPPWGYQMAKTHTTDRVILQLVPDPVAAPHAQRVYETFVANGGSLNGTLAACQFAGMPRTQRGLKMWLANPAMIGHLIYNERRNRDGKLLAPAEVIRNAHQPVVSDELFQAAASLLEQKPRTPKPEQRKPCHPLTGLLRCPSCGYLATFTCRIHRCSGSPLGRYRREAGEETVRFSAYCRRVYTGDCTGSAKELLNRDNVQRLLDETVAALCAKATALSDWAVPAEGATIDPNEQLLMQQIENMKRQDANLLAAAIHALEDQLEQLRIKKLGIAAQRDQSAAELQALDLMPETFAELDYWQQNALLRRFVLQVVPPGTIELRV